jgi:predicted enzyme related to lactoylglutathione lyase
MRWSTIAFGSLLLVSVCSMEGQIKQEGVKIDPKRMDEPYGRFAWIYDSDGNKIELWQRRPQSPKGAFDCTS